MCRFIGMEYLAAAAFIALDKEDVTLDELSQYGINVTKILEDSHISAVILWKKYLGFYQDNIHKENCFYSTGDGEFVWS